MYKFLVDAGSSVLNPLQVDVEMLAKMSIDLKFVELTADVLEIFL